MALILAAGIVAGTIYGLMAVQSGNLGEAVAAHAITPSARPDHSDRDHSDRDSGDRHSDSKASAVAAPELDPASMMSALAMLGAGLVLIKGRRAKG